MPALAALAGGCAITPPGVVSPNATRITFQWTLGGAVIPANQYYYFVAIRVLAPAYGDATTYKPLAEADYNPVPVYATGSVNGFVDGLPTHFVQYVPWIDPNNLYVAYYFPGNQNSSSTNEADGINLSYPAPEVRPVISGIDPSSNDNTMGFVIDTSYLDQLVPNGSTMPANGIQTIQFQILTMNNLATEAGINGRVYDYVGSGESSLNTIATQTTLSVQTNGTWTNQTQMLPQNPNGPVGGSVPSLQIVSWSVTIATP